MKDVSTTLSDRQFDRDVAFELVIARAIDLAHSPRATSARISYGPMRVPGVRAIVFRR